MKTLRGLIALAILSPIVVIGFTLAACGGELFPKCNNPKKPCPDVEPDYPPSGELGGSRKASDAGRD